MSRIFKTLHLTVSLFREDRRGNVAVIFALAILPIIGMVGASVDYSRANNLKTKFQDALDATALMLAKEASTDTSSQLQTNAVKYFNALFNQSGVNGISISASYTSTGSKVVISGTGSVPTDFMNVLGYHDISIGATSTATWGSNRLRVALILDNTGSMADAGKMTAMKSATQNLLTQLQSAASVNGDVYVSIVPFVKDVNVGPGNYNSNWIYWGTSTQDPSQSDDTSWDANNGSCNRSYSSVGYASPRAACLAVSRHAAWTPSAHSTWNGCVMDRGYPTSPSKLAGKSGPDTTNNYDTNVGAVDAAKPSSMWAAEQYASCPAVAVKALSYDWTGMSSLINNMSPNGNTNQAIGLQLGWQSLVGDGPFTAPAKDPNYQYTDVIILLTDGLNTEDRWYTIQTSIDSRQASTCSNIKAAGVTLYTIQVNTGGDPTSTLLQDCASSSDKFFLLTSANQIVTTFQAIGTKLTQLRLAK